MVGIILVGADAELGKPIRAAFQPNEVIADRRIGMNHIAYIKESGRAFFAFNDEVPMVDIIVVGIV